MSPIVYQIVRKQALYSVHTSLSLSFSSFKLLSLGLGLELAWGHFQNKYFVVYTSFKDFSLNVYDDTNHLHLVSVSQRLSNSQELTPTLTLGLSLGLGLGLAWGYFQDKNFLSTQVLKIFP